MRSCLHENAYSLATRPGHEEAAICLRQISGFRMSGRIAGAAKQRSNSEGSGLFKKQKEKQITLTMNDLFLFFIYPHSDISTYS